jgi:hypothetical protein
MPEITFAHAVPSPVGAQQQGGVECARLTAAVESLEGLDRDGWRQRAAGRTRHQPPPQAQRIGDVGDLHRHGVVHPSILTAPRAAMNYRRRRGERR